MNRRLLILLAVFTFAAAMVPRERRAMDTDEKESKPKNICAPQTPCAWTVYKMPNRNTDFNFVNTYCVCDANTTCQITEDDSNSKAFIHRCRDPVDEEDVES